MANFLIESGPAVAQSMATTDAAVDARRRKTAAYNALSQTYGPAAGDPEAQAQLQTNATNAQLDPLKVQQTQLETTEKQQSYDKNQALQGVSMLRALLASGQSPTDALNTVREQAPHLGLDDSHVAAISDALTKDPKGTLDALYNGIQGAAPFKATGGVQMLTPTDPVTGKPKVDATGQPVTVPGLIGENGVVRPANVPEGFTYDPKVSGAAQLVQLPGGGFGYMRGNAAGGMTTATLAPGVTPEKAVTDASNMEHQRTNEALALARFKLSAAREARIKSTGGVGALSPQTVDYLADEFRLTGKLPAMGQGGAALRAQIFNAAAQKAAAAGAGGQADVYAAQATRERATAVNDLGKATPGSAGGQVQALNTAISHLTQYESLLPALQSGNIVAINKARQAFSAATGMAAPTNVDTVHAALGDEIARVVAGGVNSAGDRKQMQDLLQQAGSPAQAVGATGQLKGLMAGRLDGIRQRYQAVDATDAFDAHLTPEAKRTLGVGQAAPAGGAAPAATSALRQKYGL